MQSRLRASRAAHACACNVVDISHDFRAATTTAAAAAADCGTGERIGPDVSVAARAAESVY